MSIKNLKPVLGGKFHQNYYRPLNPVKYVGNPAEIIYRSGWEAKFMRWADTHPSVLRWSSEPQAIPYISPIDKRQHKYYVDFYIVTEKEGKELKWLIEVKPNAQFKPPDETLREGRQTLKKMESYNWQLRTYLVNTAKFSAAKQFAASIGARFAVVDENFLF